jgi:hypothetical protein
VGFAGSIGGAADRDRGVADSLTAKSAYPLKNSSNQLASSANALKSSASSLAFSASSLKFSSIFHRSSVYPLKKRRKDTGKFSGCAEVVSNQRGLFSDIA